MGFFQSRRAVASGGLDRQQGIPGRHRAAADGQQLLAAGAVAGLDRQALEHAAVETGERVEIGSGRHVAVGHASCETLAQQARGAPPVIAQSEFDPATSTAVFRIGLSDDVEFGLLPPLLRRLRAEAPGIVLVVRRANYLLMPNLLASGEISVGVSYTDELPANAKRKTVRRSKPKILRADSAPGQLTLDDYCARPHALVSFAGDLSGFVDEELEKFGRKRKVVLAVPQFNGLGTLLAGTDIIATVPDYAAQALIAAGGLRAEDPPFETRAFELSMAWRGAQDNDPAERWLRSRISMFIGDPDSL